MNARVSCLSLTVLLLVATSTGGLADSASELQRGKELMIAGRYDDAIQLLSGIHTTDSALAAKVTSAIARCHYCRNEFDSALLQYNSLVNDYPAHPELADWYHMIASCYDHADNPGQAIAALDKAIELAGDPQAKVYRDTRAEILLEYDFDAAVEAYESLIRDYPDAPQSAAWRLALGLAHMNAGRCEEAKPLFREVIDLDAKGVRACHAATWLAVCLNKEGKKAEGLAVLDKCYAEGDCQGDALVCKAAFLVEYAGDYAEAVPVLKKFLADYPTHYLAKPDAQGLLVLALKKSGRLEDVVEMIKSWLPENATDEQKAKNLDRIANIYFRAKRYGEAANTFREELRTSDLPAEKEARVRYNLGVCYKEVGNIELAESYMREVVERFAESDRARQARGMLHVWHNYEGRSE